MKQVEKVWAELSAKEQEVETPQESTELSEEVKVELSEEKVELGIIQDVIQDFKKGMDLFTDAKSSMDRASEILDAAEKLYEKAEQQAKDLGVDMGSQTKKFGERLKMIAKEARSFNRLKA